MVDPSEPVEFVVVSGPERKNSDAALKAITGDSNEAQIRRAEVFVDARFWYDAIAAYSNPRLTTVTTQAAIQGEQAARRIQRGKKSSLIATAAPAF